MATNKSKIYAEMSEEERERFAGEKAEADNSPLDFDNPRADDTGRVLPQSKATDPKKE